MNRKEITKVLGEMLERDIIHSRYWAREVTFIYGEQGLCRVDYMSFKPVNQSTAGIEKGNFSAYEVKSCLEDFNSKNGHNLIMDKNYYVMPLTVYSEIGHVLPYGAGVYSPVPLGIHPAIEAKNPTALDDMDFEKVKMKCVKPSRMWNRDISGEVALFCMLRSGQ